MQERMANFEAAGTTPTIGQLTGGDKAQGTEAFLAQFYGSSPVIKNRLAAQEDAVIGANQKVADSLAPLDLATGGPAQMSNAELGNLIEDTWNNSGKKAISQTRTDFANKLADEVSPRAGVQMGNFEESKPTLSFDQESELYIESEFWTEEEVLSMSANPEAVLDEILTEEIIYTENIWTKEEQTWF
jgi:hypothetical protein